MNEKVTQREAAEADPGKGFNRDEAYAEAYENVVQLIKTELGLEGVDEDPHAVVVKIMESLAPQNENFRTLEILSEMRKLMEQDKERYETAEKYPKAAELVDHLYEVAA